MESSAVLRWGIVGTGRIAGQFVSDLAIDPSERGSKEVKHLVVVVGSRTESKAENFIKDNCATGAYGQADGEHPAAPEAVGSYDEVYNHPKVDIVYIAVPHTSHFDCAKAAIEAGKGILLEKPATLTQAESQILVDLAKSKGVFFMEGVWTRFLPLVARFKELVHVQKVIGDVHHVYADFGLAFYHLLPVQARHFNPDLAGGAQLDVGPYTILWALLALFEHPDNQNKPPSKINCSSLADPRTGVDLYTSMTIDFEGILARADLSANFMVPSPADHPVKIVGTKGELIVSKSCARPETLIVRKYQSKGPIVAVEAYEESREYFPIPGIGLAFEADAVAKAVRDGKTACELCPPETTLLSMGILDEWRMQTGYTYLPGLTRA